MKDEMWADIAIEPDTADGCAGENDGSSQSSHANEQSGAERKPGKYKPPDRECENEGCRSVKHTDDLVGASIGKLVSDGGDDGDCHGDDGWRDEFAEDR